MKSQGLGHRIVRYRHAYAFIAPFFVIFAVFGLYPTAYSLVLSFHDWSASQPWVFVAFQNYGKLLDDPVFWTSVWNVVYIYLINVPAMVVLSVIIAVVLNSPYQRFKDFFRVTYLVPYVTSVLSITIVFFVVFDDSRGLVNLLLSRIGLDPVHWLTSKKISKVSLDILVTWKWVGYNMIIALAGLQSIDTQIYDACRIDGAGTLRTFFRISLPLIRPVVGFQLIMATIGTLTMFTEPYILTDGGPGYSSLTPVLYLYRSAFKFMKLGYGAGIAFLTFVLVLVPSVIQVRLYAERGRSYTAV
ncbi:MAG TPA: sugar ABC transporter permease [Spirochaetia bacterium]|nr:sugar ABC transporter permease [Spirochaetia bacterium]